MVAMAELLASSVVNDANRVMIMITKYIGNSFKLSNFEAINSVKPEL